MFPTKNLSFLKFLLVLLAFQDVAAGVAGSIMADLIVAFPDYDPSVVMLIATIPGLFSLLPSLFYGKLSNTFTKRALLFTGLILFMIGGIMPFFLENLPLIILFRGILGLGVGITIPLSVDIIAGFFEGRTRDNLIGFGASTIACIGAIFFQVVGGMLADAYGWQYGFLVYLFPLWILAITFLFLPEPTKKQVPAASLKDILFSAPKTVYGFVLGQIAFSACVFGYVTNISIIIQKEGLGNATEAGFAISLFTLGTLVIGIFFGMLRNLWRNFSVPLGVLLTAGGIFWCASVQSLGMIYVASFVGGIGLGIVIPGVLARITELSNEEKGISFVGLGAAAQGIGGIISSFMFAGILSLLGLEGGRYTLIIGAIGLAIVGVIWALLTVRKSKASVSESDIDPSSLT